MTSGVLEFYFDFSSPYGYFAAQTVDELAEVGGRRAVWKPFLVGVAFKQTGARPLSETPLKGPYAQHDWARLGRFLRVPWRLPDPFPIATVAAARAFYWLDDLDSQLAKDFAKAVYHAYFAEGRDIGPATAVADIAAGLGVERDDLLAALQDPAVKARLRDETEAAIERGVCGSPFFIVDGEGFWGADRMGMVRDWMKQGGW